MALVRERVDSSPGAGDKNSPHDHPCKGSPVSVNGGLCVMRRITLGGQPERQAGGMNPMIDMD
jgi:hypothetical protein